MPEVTDLDELSQTPLFQGIPREELARFAQHLRARTVPEGTSILTADQPGDVMYVITSGTVKVHVERSDGRDVILAILGPGEVLGEMSAVDSLTRSATALTLEECRVFWTAPATFRRYLQTNPILAYNLLRILSRRLRLADAHIQSLAALDVYGRVARQLLAFAGEYGVSDASGGITVPIRLTQSDLADLVGASRVRVNQVVVDFRERGYISEAPGHRLIVHDREALAARCR